MTKTACAALALMMTAALAGACKSDDKAEASNSEHSADTPPPAAANKPAPAAETNNIVSSCDQRTEKGTCTDAYERAYIVGEEQVKKNCSIGTMASRPCPTDNLLGYCDVSSGSEPAYRIAYYSGAGVEFDASSAAKGCEETYMGKFAAP